MAEKGRREEIAGYYEQNVQREFEVAASFIAHLLFSPCKAPRLLLMILNIYFYPHNNMEWLIREVTVGKLFAFTTFQIDTCFSSRLASLDSIDLYYEKHLSEYGNSTVHNFLPNHLNQYFTENNFLILA